MESRELKVNGTTYVLRPFDYKTGRRWLFKLVSIVSRAGANAAESIGAMLEQLDVETFESFCDTIERFTDVRSDNGSVVELSKVSATHMQGRYQDLTPLIKARVEFEYSSFFDGLGALLAPASSEKTA